MRARCVIALFLAVLLVAACGDDDVFPTGSSEGTTSSTESGASGSTSSLPGVALDPDEPEQNASEGRAYRLVTAEGETWEGWSWTITAGGPVDVGCLDAEGCAGWAAVAPVVEFDLPAGGGLWAFSLNVPDTPEGLVLIVRSPDGSWSCGHDYQGNYEGPFGPAVEFPSAPAGTYHIWVATAAEGTAVTGNLDIATTGTSSTTTTAAASSTTTTTAGGTTLALPADTWVSLSTAGGPPSSRERAALAYDPAGARAILFGGWHGGVLGDTWSYDPAAGTWTQLWPAGDSPSPRAFAAMVHDPESGLMVLFGGTAGSTQVNETWAYDPAANTWTNLDPAGDLPSPRGFAAMVYDPVGKAMILFGGSAGGYLGDTWSYDPAANVWTELNPAGDLPSPRGGHSMVYDPDTRTVILFGGGAGDVLGDTWSYDPAVNVWTELNPAGDLPSPRGSHSMVYDPAARLVTLFGGGVAGVDGGDFNDLWAYDPAANAWTELDPAGTPPTIRWGSAAFYYPASGAVILFGGMGEFTYYNDTWAYKLAP